MEERDPARWSADPRSDDVSELLAGIRAARSEGPSVEQLARMRAAFALQPAAGGGGVLMKLLTGGLLLAVAGYFLAARTAEQPHAAPSREAVNAAPIVSTQPAEDGTGSSPVEPQPAVALPRRPPTRAPKPAPLQRAPNEVLAKEPAQPAVDGELALLRPARAHVRSSPARALELVARHEREYAHGALIEEREVIAIEALLESEHWADAEQRARRFFEQHPRSAHARRVRALLREAGLGGSAQE